MRRIKKYRLLFSIILSLLIYNSSRGQPPIATHDTGIWLNPALNTFSLPQIFYSPVFSNREDIISRSPAEGDTVFIQTNKELQQNGPGYKSYEAYADLAAAYWRSGMNTIAKKMFLLIVESKEPYYTGTLFHTAGNRYEYGSYTSNFKNGACLYLCRIFIEEKNYTKALNYLVQADKKHKIQYNCGTGAHMYKQELNKLYSVCYEGSGNTGKLIDLYLEEDFYTDESFIALLLKKYSLPELKRQLQLALDNITIIKDSWPTEYFLEGESGNADSLISRFTGGTGHTILFGRKIKLPKPELEHGEVITRQHFIDELIQSPFYCRLLKLEEKEEPAATGSSPD